MHTNTETPETIYTRFLNWGLKAGIKPDSAKALAQDRRAAHQKKMLGPNPFLTEAAGHFLAACLRKKRMPAGAQRWVAQQCLEEWLPHMNPGERAEIVAKLRKCSPAQLGPDLVAIVAQEPPNA